MCGHSLTSLLRRLDVNVSFRVTFQFLCRGVASILRAEFLRVKDAKDAYSVYSVHPQVGSYRVPIDGLL